MLENISLRDLKTKQSNLSQYTLVFSTILISGSLYYSTFFKNFFLLFFLVSLIFIYYYKYNNKFDLKFSQNKIIYVVFAILLAFGNFESKTSSCLVLATCLLCALLITEILEFKRFRECYINIIIFLSITSWMYIPVIYYDFLSPLPDFFSIINTEYSNFILFGVYRAELPAYLANNNYLVTRNSGLFWEPGAFQIFVNIGYYFSIIDKRLSKKIFLIFLITQITISSTIGILVYILLTLLLYLRNRNLLNNKDKVKILFSAIVISIISVELGIFKKLVEKFDSSRSSFMSFASRINDLILDFKMLKDNIIFGIGYGNLEMREYFGIQYFGNLEYLRNISRLELMECYYF